jgi:hypothetical protein
VRWLLVRFRNFTNIGRLHFGLVLIRECARRTSELLSTFTIHSGEVTSFIRPPAEAGHRMRNCVCSVARDNSLAIISLEEMSWYVWILPF